MGKKVCAHHGQRQRVGPAWGSSLTHEPKDLRVPLQGTGEQGEQRALAGESERQNSSPSSASSCCEILDKTAPLPRPQFPQTPKTGDDLLSHQ